MAKKSNPLVTFAVICYKQESFVAEAVLSALAQTYSPLEVVVSDDCSPDGTFDVVKKIVADYAGPHKVILNRNESNQGLSGNVNRVWEVSSGELVVFQGGDDISLPDRTRTLVEAWLSHEPHPDLVYSGVELIDDSGKTIGEKLGVVSSTPTIGGTISGSKTFVAGGCAAAYARHLHFGVGPLSKDVVAEDFVYSFRALLGNGVIGIPKPLVKYRQHQASIIGNFQQEHNKYDGKDDAPLLRGGLANLREYKRALDVFGTKHYFSSWRLMRRIGSIEAELKARESPILKVSLLMLWALITVRPRVLASLSRRVARHMKTQHVN